MGKRCTTCQWEAPIGPRGYERDCPKCGRTYTPDAATNSPPVSSAASDTFRWQLVAIVATLALVAVAIVAHQRRAASEAPAPAATARNKTVAELYAEVVPAIRSRCRAAIKAGLHDPGSVEWDQEYAIDRDGAWEVRYQYRAKNGYGAMRLTASVCSVSKVTLQVLTVRPSD